MMWSSTEMMRGKVSAVNMARRLHLTVRQIFGCLGGGSAEHRAMPWKERVALLAVLALAASGCDWTTFGYGPAHTRYNPTETNVGVGNVAP